MANFMLFLSLYMLYPVLPLMMAKQLGVPVAHTGFLYIVFTAGMFLVGPFHNYLVDALKRKYVCVFSFLIMIAAVAGYAFVNSLNELLFLSLIQGMAFGLTTTAGITLAIDITNSACRSRGNVAFSWASRFGMIIGIALGVFLFGMYDFKTFLLISMAMGFIGALFVAGIYVPFRAPIVTKVCSIDRFLLIRGVIPAINLVMIAFVPGLLLPMLLESPIYVTVVGIPVPFFGIAGLGFLITIALIRLLFRGDNKMWIQIVAGLVLMIGAICAMSHVFIPQITELLLAAVLLGLSLGLIAPEFLTMFVKLSQHCQRGTARTFDASIPSRLIGDSPSCSIWKITSVSSSAVSPGA